MPRVPNKGSFQKGNQASVGNPGPHQGRKKFITDSLISQLHELDPKTRKEKAHKVVAKLIEIASAGNVFAIKEIFDRVEGKAASPDGADLGVIKVVVEGGLPDVNVKAIKMPEDAEE